MRVRVLAIAVSIGSLLGTVQCGGRTTGEPSVIAEGEFVARFAEASCRLREDCCREAGYSSALPACQQDVMDELGKETRDAQDAGAVYDPVAAGECVNAIAPTCARNESLKGTIGRVSPCSRVYRHGTRALGAACLASGACADPGGIDVACDHFVLPDRSVSQGCVEIVARAREGESCASTSPLHVVACEDGTTCQDDRCTAPPKLGEACAGAFGDFCAEGAVCDRLDTKRCIVPRRGAGEPCSSPEQCELYRCDNGRCLGTRSVAGAAVCQP